MKIDYSNSVLNVQSGLTGEVKTIHDFFSYSSYTQQCLLEDVVLPLLYDKGSVYLTIGTKN